MSQSEAHMAQLVREVMEENTQLKEELRALRRSLAERDKEIERINALLAEAAEQDKNELGPLVVI